VLARPEPARTAAEAWGIADGWTVEPTDAHRRLPGDPFHGACGQPREPVPGVR
jgi:hypothetical protein